METTNSALGRHLSNIPDHRLDDARLNHCYHYEAFSDPEAMNSEWQSHLKWINDNVIGPPKATDWYTSTQLAEMGMIGIYAPME